jgi:hypothetical protein
LFEVQAKAADDAAEAMHGAGNLDVDPEKVPLLI